MSNDPMAEFRETAELAAVAAVSALQVYGVTNESTRVSSLSGLVDLLLDVCKGAVLGPELPPKSQK